MQNIYIAQETIILSFAAILPAYLKSNLKQMNTNAFNLFYGFI